jgi:hypothetical protein
MLVTVGRKVDSWIVRFKNSPKNTKILIVVCASSVVLFLVVLILVVFA